MHNEHCHQMSACLLVILKIGRDSLNETSREQEDKEYGDIYFLCHRYSTQTHIYTHTFTYFFFFSLLHWGNNHIFWKEKHYSFLASSFNLTAEWELKWSLDQVTYVPMHHISAGHQPQVNCTCTFSCLLPATPTGWTRSWVSSNCLILVFIYPVLFRLLEN